MEDSKNLKVDMLEQAIKQAAEKFSIPKFVVCDNGGNFEEIKAKNEGEKEMELLIDLERMSQNAEERYKIIAQDVQVPEHEKYDLNRPFGEIKDKLIEMVASFTGSSNENNYIESYENLKKKIDTKIKLLKILKTKESIKEFKRAFEMETDEEVDEFFKQPFLNGDTSIEAIRIFRQKTMSLPYFRWKRKFGKEYTKQCEGKTDEAILRSLIDSE